MPKTLAALHELVEASGYHVPPQPCASASDWQVARMFSRLPHAPADCVTDDTKIVRSSPVSCHGTLQVGVGVLVGVSVGVMVGVGVIVGVGDEVGVGVEVEVEVAVGVAVGVAVAVGLGVHVGVGVGGGCTVFQDDPFHRAM